MRSLAVLLAFTWCLFAADPLARAAVAIGADGMIVEVYPNPEKAVSDGAQPLDPRQWAQMMHDSQPYFAPWKQARVRETVASV